MHQLQQHILTKLIGAAGCRYRDLKPKEVEGNLFTYHLKQLIDEGLLSKSGQTYDLTAKGLQYVGSLSLKDYQPRVQPKIVTLIAVKNKRGDWLLYRRSKQPFRGQVGFPYGKLHLNETIEIAARRELKEKTGIEADLHHAGETYITVTKNDELIASMLCHIFSGKNPHGELMKDSPIGNCFWAKVTNPAAKDFFPGFKEIHDQLRKERQSRFFEEVFINS